MKKKKIIKPQKTLTAAEHQKIYDLYWDENYSQKELTEMFGLSDNTGHISRIVNGQSFPHARSIFLTKQELKKNIIPSKNEPKQAKTLRAKREKLPSTKLTFSKVEKMREEYFSGSISQMALAKKFGINQSTLNHIVRGIKWKLNK